LTITVIASVRVKNGNMEAAIDVLKEIVPKIRESEPGLLAYIPHTVKQDPNAIIFYEKYADGDAMKQHMANLAKNMEKFSPLLEPGMDLKNCSEIV